ncbi:hypothetical protein LWI28_013194 [Acer negundo]|uniref:Photosystem I reaction center subunit VI n=1 Tax=Acer negundo TaxID=4023 RepID=A0AAD5NJ12_ACENE|nr:hypothetical protein LWI28_013194 [Acer negundo]
MPPNLQIQNYDGIESSSVKLIVVVLVLIIMNCFFAFGDCTGGLELGFYKRSCPNAEMVVKMKMNTRSHSLGISHCRNFEGRLWPLPDPTLSPPFARMLQLICMNPTSSDVAFAQNDATIFSFDNQYFIDILCGRGLLRLIQRLLDPRTQKYVYNFGQDTQKFFDRSGAVVAKYGDRVSTLIWRISSKFFETFAAPFTKRGLLLKFLILGGGSTLAYFSATATGDILPIKKGPQLPPKLGPRGKI